MQWEYQAEAFADHRRRVCHGRSRRPASELEVMLNIDLAVTFVRVVDLGLMQRAFPIVTIIGPVLRNATGPRNTIERASLNGHLPG